MSKILMVQMKAQLGKGWTHCTDITPTELTHVKFRACSETEKTSGYLDGASFRGTEHVDYDMLDSYQAQYECMNFDELEDYVESQIPVDFSETHISEMLEEIRPELGD